METNTQGITTWLPLALTILNLAVLILGVGGLAWRGGRFEQKLATLCGDVRRAMEQLRDVEKEQGLQAGEMNGMDGKVKHLLTECDELRDRNQGHEVRLALVEKGP